MQQTCLAQCIMCNYDFYLAKRLCTSDELVHWSCITSSTMLPKTELLLESRIEYYLGRSNIVGEIPRISPSPTLDDDYQNYECVCLPLWIHLPPSINSHRKLPLGIEAHSSDLISPSKPINLMLHNYIGSCSFSISVHMRQRPYSW